MGVLLNRFRLKLRYFWANPDIPDLNTANSKHFCDLINAN